MSPHDISQRGVLRAMLRLSAFTMLLFVAFLWGYRLIGLRLLEPLDDSVGEVLLKEGLRCEEAGLLDLAKARYEAALAGRFAGPQNRATTNAKLGTLWWREGQFEAALPLLEKAVGGVYAKPEYLKPYCDSLIALNRVDEAERALALWDTLLAEAGSPSQREERMSYAGRLALLAGRKDDAQALFAAGEALFTGGACSAALARLAEQAGDPVAAKRHATAFVCGGGTGPDAQEMRALIQASVVSDSAN